MPSVNSWFRAIDLGSFPSGDTSATFRGLSRVSSEQQAEYSSDQGDGGFCWVGLSAVASLEEKMGTLKL
jgi:hypothetical protein